VFRRGNWFRWAKALALANPHHADNGDRTSCAALSSAGAAMTDESAGVGALFRADHH